MNTADLSLPAGAPASPGIRRCQGLDPDSATLGHTFGSPRSDHSDGSRVTSL